MKSLFFVQLEKRCSLGNLRGVYDQRTSENLAWVAPKCALKTKTFCLEELRQRFDKLQSINPLDTFKHQSNTNKLY